MGPKRQTEIMLIIMMMIIIAFTGAIQDLFYNFLTAPRTVSNTVRSSGLGAFVCKSRETHRALVTCNMSCYVSRGTKGQLSYYV